jgi:L-amino acid N-acyltransferase YncA
MMIRLARPEDAAGIQAIYAPVVRDTPISFELEPPGVADMQSRIASTLSAGLPWLVLDNAGEIDGYVYAGRHRGDRPAYQWSVEVSVYIAEGQRGRGIGRALYTSLFAVLELQRFQNAFAGATLPNAGSVALHESMGFVKAGLFEKVGFKNGSWHDVIWWRKPLGNHDTPPAPVRWLNEAVALQEWPAALGAGERMLLLNGER